ncbi:MAG: YDG domain-containing protein, partial [Candidatus Paceibacterota bacterium]
MIRKHFFFKILLPYIAVWGVLFYSLTAFATVGITPATGGSAISADTTGGAYTILTGPIIQEGAFRDFPATKTFILTAPGGFAFNTGATVTATITRTAGTGSCFAFTSATATPTASTITFTLNARDGAPTTTRCRVVFSNIQVRPTAGTPLASGNITKSGTAAVSGITNGVTNLGTLTEVVGVKNKLAFTTQPSVTASVNTDFAVKPVIKLQDQFGNTVTTDNASAIARVAVLGTQACGGTAGSGTVSSTPTDGAAVTSGIMTYTAMRYSVAENIKICATSAGVTSALSGAVTVNTITTTTTLGTSQSPQTYGTPVIFTATVTPAFGGAPSGTVTFKDGATIIGTGTLNGANPGVASYGTSTLSFSGSPHSITAVYNGDNSFSGSTSGAIFQTITAKALTVIGMTADNKEYDGGITAMLSGGTLNGIVGSDVVSINTRAGSFSDKFAGIGKTVNVTSVTLAGPDSSNYTVALPVGISANITAKALTVTGMTATNKEYDGFNTVALSGGTLVGIINPDVVSINTRAGSFADKFAGIGKTVSVTAIALTGADSSNYTTTLPTGITADITEKNITVVGVSANDKTYDGNATAVLNTGSAALVGIISGDTVVLDASVATASFDSPDIGLNKPITVSGLALSGMDAPNYNLSQPIGITADITNPVPITTSITPASKETGDAGFTLTVNGSGFISGSVVKFNGSSRMTSFVNSGSLTAEILAGDVATATSSALITVFNPTPGGGTSNAQTFVVAHAATQFVILPSLAGTVDASTTVTVQAQKANGSVDTTYQDDVTLNATGSATGEGLVNIVDGVGVLSLRDTVAETVHLTLADSQSTGLAVTSSQDIVFVAGAVTQFVLNDPGNMNARTRLGYQLTRKDQYGNAVSAGILTAYLYSSSLSADHKFYGDPLLENIITSVSFSDGSAAASFWYYDDMPGVYDISVSDNTPVADGNTGIDDATRSVTVIPVAVKFVIITATSTSVDLPLTVTVQAQKTDNTVDVSFQDDVTLNATGSVTGEGTVNMVNGVGTKQLSNMFVENVVLSLADSQSTGLDVSSTANVAW